MPPKFALKAKPAATASPGPVVYPPYNPNPITLEEEVLAGVIEWYMARGLPVPQEDLDACKGIDAAAAAATKAEMAAPAPPPKPAYGTPEFWKEWWAKKRAKEAAAREAGEPIPEPKPKKKKRKEGGEGGT
jgi:hypothetical protein